MSRFSTQPNSELVMDEDGHDLNWSMAFCLSSLQCLVLLSTVAHSHRHSPSSTNFKLPENDLKK